jgi:hypothetical protein
MVAGGLSFPTRIEFGSRSGATSHRPQEVLVSRPEMHFGFYLMIAALVLMGLELLYALYQLATFL